MVSTVPKLNYRVAIENDINAEATQLLFNFLINSSLEKHGFAVVIIQQIFFRASHCII
jgi:hypothetical protein